jgi:hypothetical protein
MNNNDDNDDDNTYKDSTHFNTLITVTIYQSVLFIQELHMFYEYIVD